MTTKWDSPRLRKLLIAAALLVLGGVTIGLLGEASHRWRNTFLQSSAEVSSQENNSALVDDVLERQAYLAQVPSAQSRHGGNRTPDLANMTHDSRYARYDNIIVEVKPDGTLWVLGERMGADAFRSLLGDQLHDQLRTLVTIRPDQDCAYRYVGQVISLCDEMGIPHQMVAVPPVQATHMPG